MIRYDLGLIVLMNVLQIEDKRGHDGRVGTMTTDATADRAQTSLHLQSSKMDTKPNDRYRQGKLMSARDVIN